MGEPASTEHRGDRPDPATDPGRGRRIAIDVGSVRIGGGPPAPPPEHAIGIGSGLLFLFFGSLTLTGIVRPELGTLRRSMALRLPRPGWVAGSGRSPRCSVLAGSPISRRVRPPEHGPRPVRPRYPTASSPPRWKPCRAPNRTRARAGPAPTSPELPTLCGNTRPSKLSSACRAPYAGKRVLPLRWQSHSPIVCGRWSPRCRYGFPTNV